MRVLAPDAATLLGRDENLFAADLASHERELSEVVKESSFLVVGGAGSIGQAMVKEIFKRSPRALHVVDLSENNLAELVRDIRSSLGYIEGELRALPLDCGGPELDAFVRSRDYDYVVNLSALKHVRSEKDPYSLMRLIRVNVLNAVALGEISRASGARKYFTVSTDKAANPVNMMGASKRIMEKFLMRISIEVPVSLARFANVAFSDGSLLDGFLHRIRKGQPLSAPDDVRRYFMTLEESGVLCLLSTVFGENRDIFFPKTDLLLPPSTFAELAEKLLRLLGYEAVPCSSEEEARRRARDLITTGRWPCYFFTSDTSGEKDLEEFYTGGERLQMDRFEAIGVISNEPVFEADVLERFERRIDQLLRAGTWTKRDLVELFDASIPEFEHHETFKYLDDRM